MICSSDEELIRELNACRKKPIVCKSSEIYVKETRKCVPKPIIYRPYPTAKNYYEGNITWDQYVSAMDDTIAANPNALVVDCPAYKPFSMGNGCTAC